MDKFRLTIKLFVRITHCVEVIHLYVMRNLELDANITISCEMNAQRMPPDPNTTTLNDSMSFIQPFQCQMYLMHLDKKIIISVMI